MSLPAGQAQLEVQYSEYVREQEKQEVEDEARRVGEFGGSLEALWGVGGMGPTFRGVGLPQLAEREIEDEARMMGEGRIGFANLVWQVVIVQPSLLAWQATANALA